MEILQHKFSRSIMVNERLVVFHFCMSGSNAGNEYEVRSNSHCLSRFNMIHIMANGLMFQFKNAAELPQWMMRDSMLLKKLNDAILTTW